MNIQREFLYSDTNKMIPVQLMRTNYGISDTDPTLELLSSKTIQKKLDISLPANGSFVVLLINQEDSKISDIVASQIGRQSTPENIITLNLYDDKSYWIYIISKEYGDGFVSTNLKVETNPEVGSVRYSFSTKSTEKRLNIPSKNLVSFENENSPTQWYNYTGSYAGKLVWETPVGSAVGSSKLAHEAVLQNIRFVKEKLESMETGLWTTINGINSLMLSSLSNLTNIISSRAAVDAVLNITNSNVNKAKVDVLWKKINGEWSGLGTIIDDLGNNVKLIKLGTSFNEVGKYVIMVQPRKEVVKISGNIGSTVIVLDELNAGLTKNYYYGYNAQLYKNDRPIDGPKVIIESKFNGNAGQYLKISPLFSNTTTSLRDYTLELSSNEFIPVLIEVDIVEHNATTLSYSMYGTKEFNTATGMVTLWDYAGNVYKQMSFGKQSNVSTGGNIIEYRIPLSETARY